MIRSLKYISLFSIKKKFALQHCSDTISHNKMEVSSWPQFGITAMAVWVQLWAGNPDVAGSSIVCSNSDDFTKACYSWYSVKWIWFIVPCQTSSRSSFSHEVCDSTKQFADRSGPVTDMSGSWCCACFMGPPILESPQPLTLSHPLPQPHLTHDHKIFNAIFKLKVNVG